MKEQGYKVELVTEYAKELTYAGADMSNQLLITGTQYERMRVLRGNVDYIITDSPILLGTVYCDSHIKRALQLILQDLYLGFDNLDVFLHRSGKYDNYGRSQTEDEAIEKDKLILGLPITFSHVPKYNTQLIMNLLGEKWNV